jgi:hypothetical protein
MALYTRVKLRMGKPMVAGFNPNLTGKFTKGNSRIICGMVEVNGNKLTGRYDMESLRKVL